MKNKFLKSFVILMMMSLCMASCSKNDEIELYNENSIIGRWHFVGFEQTVLYQFTEKLRYTIYSTNGNFGSLDTAIPNPNPWLYQGENIVIDLHFGNSLVAKPVFKCNGNVVELVTNDGTITLFKEGYNLANCSE